MSEQKLKVIILTHGGAERFLELLVEEPDIDIAGIFVETATGKRRRLLQKIRRSIRYDGYFETLKKFTSRLFGIHEANEIKSVQDSQNELIRRIREFNIPISQVESYHSADAIKSMRATEADLGILYGTNIVDESVFGIPRLGSINIHQGMAPMYRGGPPVFWELFNNEKEVGITVHYVASKVDSGDIILQTTVPLEYDFLRYGSNYQDFLTDFSALLKEPSAKLLLAAVRQIAEAKEQRTIQDTTLGKRYKLPIKSEKDALLHVLLKRHNR